MHGRVCFDSSVIGWLRRPSPQHVFLSATLLQILLWGSTASAVDKPNIVLLVSDDQGYRDLGCFGSQEIRTPHLDRLARGGVRLTQFYVTWPACTPSRGSLLTGRYPQRHGVFDMIRNEAPDYGHRYTPGEYAVTFERIGGMDRREVLLSNWLANLGYTCGIVGKWDLGSLKRFLPTSRGFHSFYGFVNTGIDYFTHERYGVPSMFRGEAPTTEDRGQYATDIFRREALAFLDQHHDRRFFLYVPFNAPHSASNLRPEVRTAAQSTETYRKWYPQLQEEAELVERAYRGDPHARVHNRASRRLEYAAAVSCMDAAIGEILDRLKHYQVDQQTIVIFLSDNGGGGGADNQPLRGGKGQLFEGGLRVPCIVRYPGRLPAGATCHEFLSTLEILPSILSAVDTAPPTTPKLDGHVFWDTLAGDAPSPRRELCWQQRGDRAARVGSWKWVDSARGQGLFNLDEDPGEQHDLSSKHPAELARVQQRFAAWRDAMARAEPRGPFRDY